MSPTAPPLSVAAAGPLQTIDVGWVGVVVSLLVPGVAAGLFCTPFLIAGRVRALFRALPPRGGLVGSYVCAALLGSVPFWLGTLAALSSTADAARGAATSNALLAVLGVLVPAYTVGVPLLAGVALPFAGYDWDPAGYGPGTWALLGGLGLWYAATFAVPLVLFAFVLALPT